MDPALLEKIAQIFPEDRFSTHPDQLAVASRDESTLDPVLPSLVVWARDAQDVSRLVKLCRESQIPITTRGAGSALEGSTIPSEAGVVLDMSRMTDIERLWAEDLQVTVQPGVIYDDLNRQIKDEGLFFPPAPGGSGDVATIGGMISTNASGIYSVKYGGTKDYILLLEVVTGTGEIMTIGSRAIKRSSGYNLVDLVCGSEGTLAIVTSATLRLAGLPEGRRQTAFAFDNDVDAAEAVSEMCRYGIDVAAIEFLDRALIQALNQLKEYGLEEKPCLFLEFHGPEAVLDSNAELAESVCTELNGVQLRLKEGQRPWEIRHFATDAVKHRKPGSAIVRNDVAFPISQLPEMVEFCHQLGSDFGLVTHTFGHVGMGLLHALILADPKNEVEWTNAHTMSDLIIRRAVELKGTISGEHGIGLGHKNLLDLEHGDSIDLMRSIKKAFDPDNILNPGKIFNL